MSKVVHQVGFIYQVILLDIQPNQVILDIELIHVILLDIYLHNFFFSLPYSVFLLQTQLNQFLLLLDICGLTIKFANSSR